MTFLRFLAALLAIGALATTQARADSIFQHAASVINATTVAEGDEEDQGNERDSHDRGVLQGAVVGVDYARGILRLQTSKRGRVDVHVLPGTNIVRHGDQYATMADLAQGAHISVFVSEVAGHLTAQLIRIH
ncbi:MAG: hypothetical protein NVS1B14_06550 [Vulcanimicrobiaceae bacterium]